MLSISHSVGIQLCLKFRDEVYEFTDTGSSLLSTDLGKCSNKLVSAWPSTLDANPNAISNPRVVQSLGIHGFLITEHNIFKRSGSSVFLQGPDKTKHQNPPS